jgi:hypothetical protein
VRFARLKAEDVARQVEAGDLAPAVFQHLVGADGARDYLIEIFGFVTFAIDLGIARILKGRAHQRKRSLHGRASETVRRARGLDDGAGSVGVHGGLLQII